MTLEYKMKTIKVRIKCTVCGKFDKIIDVDVNEYGYFSASEAYCPECLCVMEQIWDHHKKDE